MGGPFYYIEKGMGEKWKWLAKLFSFFGVGVGLFGIGTFTQVNGITSAANNFFDPNNAHMISLFGRDYSWSVVIAGLILELSAQYPGVEIKMIPGVTAACAGAAGLGAPLTHDFAVVSLSDRLTPIEMIWERIEKAAQADFVICLYNPRSKGRPDYLKQACERIMKYRSPETVCGVASCIGRDGEEMKVISLKELADYPADMFTTVFIGKTSTVKIGKWMVTPRGYLQKKEK